MKLHWTAGLAVGLGILLAAGDFAVAQRKKRDRDDTPRKTGRRRSETQPRKSEPPPRRTTPERKKRRVKTPTRTRDRNQPGRRTQPPPTKRRRQPPTTGKRRPPMTTGKRRPPTTTGKRRPPTTTGKRRPPVTTGKRRPPITTGKRRPPITTGKRRPPITTLPGFGKRRTPGSRGPVVIGGRQPRLPISRQARIAELRRRNLALSRHLQTARTNRRNISLRSRRDWQLWHRDHYSRYRWISGRWNSPWLGRWDTYWQRRWRRRYPVLLTFGTTWWGLNRLGYQFGYFDYYNPYAGTPIALGGGVMLDYSQPICQPVADGTQGQESQSFALARKAFMERNYKLALSDINDALKDSPQDAAMHEFRGLVLFALGDYQQAAAPLNAVLAVGPGWDWKTIRGLYPDGGTYTKQLRALEGFVGENPKDPAGHFVLGYHYLATGYGEHALKEFQQASDLAPKDAVAGQMVTMLSKGTSKDNPNEADNEPPLPETTAGTAAVTLEKLTGNWTATRGKETFNLALTKEDRFTWTHTDAAGKKTVVKGVYALEKGALALEVDSGGVMMAEVSLPSDSELKFRMINDKNKDPGLTFSKK